MRFTLTGVMVDDQQHALDFYTNTLGFVVRHNIDMGEHAWITVVSPHDIDGTELLLEPTGHPAARPYRDALRADGIPATQFSVDDIDAEYERLVAAGVEFTAPPMDTGAAKIAIFDDTCGNWIVIVEQTADTPAE